jgi:hypothetical protein
MQPALRTTLPSNVLHRLKCVKTRPIHTQNVGTRVLRSEVDGTGSGSWPVAGSGISGV